jgi:hypothetical protein
VNRTAARRGEFYVGQAVQFDTAKRGKSPVMVQAVCVEFAGSRWVVRTTDGKTWRCPASMLTAAKLDAGKARELLAAGEAREQERDEAQAQRAVEANARLASTAAQFRPGMAVDVVHRGTWGWRATVVKVQGGKVTVTNPTRDLIERVEALGGDAHRGFQRRTSATVTVWANRVRLPGSRAVPGFGGLFGF